MNKHNKLKGYAPVLLMAVLAVVLGILLLFYCHKRLATPAEPSPDDNAAEETKPDSES